MSVWGNTFEIMTVDLLISFVALSSPSFLQHNRQRDHTVNQLATTQLHGYKFDTGPNKELTLFAANIYIFKLLNYYCNSYIIFVYILGWWW